jgi:hypothetical protein
MVLDFESAHLGDLDLAFLNVGIVELFDVAALHTNDMIVVAALLQLENGFAGLEVMAYEEPRLLELRKNTVDRREARIGALLEERLVDVLRGEMAHGAFLEDFEYPQPWHGCLEADGFEVCGRAHGECLFAGELSY